MRMLGHGYVYNLVVVVFILPPFIILEGNGRNVGVS